MNILWFHFHCWHNAGVVGQKITRDHGLTPDRVALQVQRCCQCPAKREGFISFDGAFTKPDYWRKPR